MDFENNKATIRGKILENLTFDYEVFGEKIYSSTIDVIRTSGTHDIIPIKISERAIDVQKDRQGAFVNVLGQFRSYDRYESDRRKLILYMFVDEMSFIDDLKWNNHSNNAYIDGYICKEPVFRETPKGREIADVLLAVNRACQKTDYIPCVFWGRNAHYVTNLEVGTRLQLNGRIQSREYLKKMPDKMFDKRTAYEFSVGRMAVKND